MNTEQHHGIIADAVILFGSQIYIMYCTRVELCLVLTME